MNETPQKDQEIEELCRRIEDLINSAQLTDNEKPGFTHQPPAIANREEEQ